MKGMRPKEEIEQFHSRMLTVRGEGSRSSKRARWCIPFRRVCSSKRALARNHRGNSHQALNAKALNANSCGEQPMTSMAEDASPFSSSDIITGESFQNRLCAPALATDKHIDRRQKAVYCGAHTTPGSHPTERRWWVRDPCGVAKIKPLI